MENKKRIGYAICGAFGALAQAEKAAKSMIAEGYELTPIFSKMVYSADTHYGKAADRVMLWELLCGNQAVRSLVEAASIAREDVFDLLIIAPCSGNTLAKLTYGLVDSAVTMAVKRQLQAEKPVLIALYTDDDFGFATKNIALQLLRRNIHFVPVRRRDSDGIRRIEADFDLIPEVVRAALKGEFVSQVYLPD